MTESDRTVIISAWLKDRLGVETDRYKQAASDINTEDVPSKWHESAVADCGQRLLDAQAAVLVLQRACTVLDNTGITGLQEFVLAAMLRRARRVHCPVDAESIVALKQLDMLACIAEWAFATDRKLS